MANSDLEARLEAVERRLSALEKAHAEGAPLAAQETESLEMPRLREGLTAGIAIQLGRFLLIFGGAYLLRAITDEEIVPTGLGLSMGAAYALFWLFMAYRAAGREGQGASAVFYGVASTLLALPLLIEACTRFNLLSGPQGILALTVFCALALAVGGLREMSIMGWLSAGGGIPTAFVLLRAMHTAIPVSIFLTLLALGCLWVSYWRHWVVPKWIAALGAWAGVLTLVILSNSEFWELSARTGLMAGAGLLLGYFLSFVVYTHRWNRRVAMFEPTMSVLVLAITGWAAWQALSAGEVGGGTIGGFGLFLGLVCYASAFTPETRLDRGRNYHFYSTFGLIVAVAGSAVLLTSAVAAAGWAVLAVLLAWLSGRHGWVSLSWQCTLLLLAAAAGSGVLLAGIQALAGDPAAAWPEVGPWHLIVASATVASLFVPVAHHSERWGRLSGVPQLVVLALSVWAVGGLLVAFLAPWIAGVPAEDADLGALAALRTGVLAGSAVTLALSSLHPRWPEARWLAYPVLIVIAVKLVIEDFPLGHPASLFVSLALVGGSMIAVSRLMGRKPAESGLR